VQSGCKGTEPPRSLFVAQHQCATGAVETSDPWGTFEVNQLLDGSIGLSPLDQACCSDLRVNTKIGPPQGFHPTWSKLSQDHHLSGPVLHDRSTQDRDAAGASRAGGQPNPSSGQVLSLGEDGRGMGARSLSCKADSSIRVTKRES